MNTVSTTKRPAELRNAFRLLFASLIIEAISFAFGGTYSWQSFVWVFIGIGITFFLMVKANEGHNWARLATAFFITLGLLSYFYTLEENYRVRPGETSVDGIATVMTVIALGLLFTKASNVWFSTVRDRSSAS